MVANTKQTSPEKHNSWHSFRTPLHFCVSVNHIWLWLQMVNTYYIYMFFRV